MRRLPLLWYSRNVSRAHYGMDDDGLFNADCACGVTLAGNEPSTFADAERWHAEQVRKEPREKPCGPALPSGIPGVAPAPDEIAAAEERGRRRGVEERDTRIEELEAALQRCRVWISEATHPKYPRGPLLDRLDAALAPRDSGKEMDAAEDAIAAKRKARQDEEAEAFKYADDLLARERK